MANGNLGRSSALPAKVAGKRALRGLKIAFPTLLLTLFALPSFASAVNLPDGRVFEEVTPVLMHGNSVEYPHVSANGETVFYQSTGSFKGESGGKATVPYVAARTPSGWETYETLPSAKEYAPSSLEPITATSSDLVKSISLLTGPFENSINGSNFLPGRLFLQEAPGGLGGFTPTKEVDLTPSSGYQAGERQVLLFAESGDLSHLYFLGVPNFGEEVLPSRHLQELAVVGPDESDGTGTPVDECGSDIGGNSTTLHSIAPDGSVVVLTANKCVFSTAGPGAQELYARVNGDETVAISEPSLGYCPGLFGGVNPICKDAVFQGASTDDSKIFFTSAQAEEAPGVTDTTNNIYEAELTGASTKRVTKMVQISAGDTSGEGARVQGVVRISDDGSHVYFVANGVLTGAPGPEGTVAQNGAENLYVYDNGATRFIGDLCSSVGASGSVADPRCPNGSGDSALWAEADNRPAWAAPYGYASANGNVLVFDTSTQLITTGPEADTDTTSDIYEYDTHANTLVRISVGRSGYDDNGNSNVFGAVLSRQSWEVYGREAPAAADEATIGASFNTGRPVSNDGSFVFFTTSEALQSDDVNSAPDVYEWHAGLVSLISDGQDPGTVAEVNRGENANIFLSTSADGRDAFFQTPDTLVPEGGQSPVQIYDARIGGGFSERIVPPPCREDACQGSLSSTPSFPSPSSALYASGGNVTSSTPLEKKAKPKKGVKRAKAKSKKKHHKKSKTVKTSNGKAGK